MARADEFDGFISMRTKGQAFARDLKTILRKDFYIRAAEESNVFDVNPESHVVGAEEIIGTTNFTVIILSEEGLDPSYETEKPSYQVQEMIAAQKARDSRRDSARPHGIFIVHLSDDFDPQVREDMEALLLEKAGLSLNSNFLSAPKVKDEAGRWNDVVGEVATRVSAFLRTHDIGLARERVMTRKRPKVHLEDAERRYLETHLGSWLKGQIEPTASPVSDDGVSTGKYHHSTLFEFDAQRCLTLRGSKIIIGSSDGGDASGGARKAEKRDRPLMRFVFEDKNKPVILLGTAGAGKSTTLAISAALSAARADPEFRALASELFETDMAESARDFEKYPTCHVPVLMRCSTLAEALGPGDEGAEMDRRSLWRAMIRLIHEVPEDTDPTAEQREALEDRLKKQPYLLILDGLDEVMDDRRAKRILRLVRGLYDRRGGHDGLKLEILLSSRPTERPLDGVYCVELYGLKIAEIEAYFERYAESIPETGSSQRQQFVETAMTQFRSYGKDRGGDNMQDFLSLPFNLNCFCWLMWGENASKKDSPPPTQTAFFRTIVERLLKEKPPAMNGQELTSNQLRLVLRRLAYDALLSGNEMTTLPFAEAEKNCRHTLSVALSYTLEHERVEVPPTYPTDLLNFLCNSTDLLEKTDNNNIRFMRQRFCEYLAGERIDSDALATAMLATLEREKLNAIVESLCFCYALRLEWDVADYANNVIDGLMNRAERARPSTDEDPHDSFSEMLAWIDAALKCLRSGVETAFDDEARNMLDPRIYDPFRERAKSLLLECEGKVARTERATTIMNFLRLCRRSEADTTVIAVRKLIEEITDGIGSRWREIDIEETNGSIRPILVERTPVLVCEYEKFLASPDHRAETFWDHAPEAHRDCIDEVTAQDDTWDPVEEWRSLRRNPGNPVVYVSWYEAVAYARWMDSQPRLPGEEGCIRLPTVWEMQQICKFAWDDADRPWSEGSNPAEFVNCRDFSYNGTTPPGAFPAQEELFDLVGNVRIWTAVAGSDGRVLWPPKPDTDWPFLFGGSWIDTTDQFYRHRPPKGHEAFDRRDWIGIRLVRDLNMKPTETA